MSKAFNTKEHSARMVVVRNLSCAVLIGVLFGGFAPVTVTLSADHVGQCSSVYEPVCGAMPTGVCAGDSCISVYESFWNGCELERAHAEYLHAGACFAMERGAVRTSASPARASVYDRAFVPSPQCRAWYDGCNTCTRAADGSYACTERSCKQAGRGFCKERGEEPEPIAAQPRSAAPAIASVLERLAPEPATPGIPNTGEAEVAAETILAALDAIESERGRTMPDAEPSGGARFAVARAALPMLVLMMSLGS